MSNTENAKIRVAVLGGGVAALTTAFELTSTPELRARYDVTLYQLGWRLGGKGASGRNREIADRIEEHGLHIWMGFYENAFRAMRAAYEELGRKPGEPLATWEQAFHKHSYIVLEEKLDDGFHPWTFVFPTNYLQPGEGGVLPTPLAYAQMLIQWIIELWESCEAARSALPSSIDAPQVPEWVSALISKLSPDPQKLGAVDHARGHGSVLSQSPPAPSHPVSLLASHVLRLLRALDDHPLVQNTLVRHAIAWLIEALMSLAWLLLGGRVNSDFELHKLWVCINLAGSAAAGIIADAIPTRGWDSIDGQDLRGWLHRHGANSVTLQSGLIRGIYDLAFAYEQGKIARPAFAAGTAMRGMLRMLLTYKGAIFYRMQAGMGDTVAVPFYQVLQKRGVKFKFFHRVSALRLSADQSLVQRIELCKQVKLAPGVEEYQPLFPVKGLPCWPSAPDYSQISDGLELKASGINLESSWAPRWKDEEQICLELGRDFDQVVLGVSIAALEQIGTELLAASRELKQSVHHVQTVQTQALQLWLTKDTRALGWQSPAGVTEGPVLGAFYEPIDTWADMSDLVRRENWPDTNLPQSIAYFCGPLPDAQPIPPFSDHAFPSRELARYQELVRGFLNTQVKDLWPHCVTPDGSFLWELLVDLQDQRGAARLSSQYTRVNIDPTERYVLSVPGSTQYRLRADQLPFANLVLSGDWTYNGINAGCVEAAVMGGMFASRALCGVPEHIVGEEDMDEQPRSGLRATLVERSEPGAARRSG
ncbi:MAG TPA: NAD(P)-binding protein [Polyangiaceae bacterium]|nr:NAD(P)-binding protein [Polyangiaceae bacterium]